MLFVGNSITIHGEKADIGWSGNRGMATIAKMIVDAIIGCEDQP